MGPTATGKSSLAFQLAKEFNAVIVNADSVQIYDKVHIGAAKPSPSEMEQVEHLLYGIIKPTHKITAGQYYKLARKVILERLAHQHVFLVGGSGFYIQALERGMYSAPSTDPIIEKRIIEETKILGAKELYERLLEKDPKYAHRISENDTYRIIRALVIIEQKKQKMSDVIEAFENQEENSSFSVPKLKIGLKLERELLRKKVHERVLEMIQNGLENEVRELLQEGLKDWAPLNSVGYKETVDYLQGQGTEQEWIDSIVRGTMQLAKKQKTWFQRDKEIIWYDSLNQRLEAETKVRSYLLTEGNPHLDNN
ncbi:MAG: tRNA (adenosine(37)-N6)-dimethylallyltransferase MiaA [Bdellovibrionales bacterium]|nr:tRNA (adenosine(37)-N6)-dimethylallyltransferase MiaA [Bdellovibrionales bacterium]